ncbi:MAG: methionyl-tRNA formyltransferase [Alphaproteobacteria bacterium]|nr:methionyl-tRNA formyltransferase [Alphaproteobacteria bacterium]
MSLKVVFMGTPEFAVPALRGLLDSEFQVVGVYSQPPRPAHRGQKLTPSPVHRLAEERGVPVFTPVNFKTPESVDELKGLGADIAVVAAYGLLLPKSVLEAFPKGCVNIHPSALPRWRGAAPIHRTVLAGDAQTEICIMQMDEGLDTGAVLTRKTYPLPANITTGKLHDYLAEEAAPLLLSTMREIAADTAVATPQAADGVTYAQKISKAEAAIDWVKSAVEIDRQVRGLNPYPVAVCTLGGEPLKIWECTVETGIGKAGTIVDDRLGIATGEGILRPTIVQRAGKKPMSTEEFLRGTPVSSGTVVS